MKFTGLFLLQNRIKYILNKLYEHNPWKPTLMTESSKLS